MVFHRYLCWKVDELYSTDTYMVQMIHKGGMYIAKLAVASQVTPPKIRALESTRCLLASFHSLDGVTNPKYKLLHFIQLTIFFKKKRALAFNRNRCCHLALCLRLILFHCTPRSKPNSFLCSKFFFFFLILYCTILFLTKIFWLYPIMQLLRM